MEFQHYVYSTLSVHKSHCMATHGPLQLRFCTYCGAYGRHKSCHLKRPCPLIPSKAGLQALRMLNNDVNPGFRKEHPRGSKTSVLAPRKCSFGKLRRAKEAYKTSRANFKRLTFKGFTKNRQYLPKGLSVDTVGPEGRSSKRRMDEPLSRPPSLSLAAAPDFERKKASTSANPSIRNTLSDSIGCPKCWPLGASELGYCICEDLDLVNVQPLTVLSSKPISLASSSCAIASPSPITYDSDTTSLPKTQEANTCSRCWPLGASELGYCICSDLALAGILPPATLQ
jgi:hypothetical protein